MNEPKVVTPIEPTIVKTLEENRSKIHELTDVSIGLCCSIGKEAPARSEIKPSECLMDEVCLQAELLQYALTVIYELKRRLGV